MLNQFSEEYKKIMIDAEARAKRMSHIDITPEDVFLQIIQIKQGNIFDLFASFGLNETIMLEVFSRPPFSETLKHESWDYTGIAPRTKEIIILSMKIAANFKKSQVGVEDFLLALFQIQTETWFYQMLDFVGVSPKDFEAQLTEVNQLMASLGGNPESSNTIFAPIDEIVKMLENTFNPWANNGAKHPFGANAPQQGKKKESDTPALDVFGHDLTADARDGKIDPIIGRDREIERLISILNRKTKNNPCLVGDPGVGKTAIVEWLALRIAEGNVPFAMRNKRVLTLDISSMVAGTKYRGEFENRIKQVIEEASTMENEVILFIDEIHTIIGAGSGEGSLDAANILKPAMARGKICLIGATTLSEYQKYIEKDSALERRFQKIDAPEPTKEVTEAIIQGIRSSFEDFHNLVIENSAISEAVALSTRYITDRFLPDKAIDLIDEACSAKSMSYHFDDSEILKLKEEIQILQKEIESLLVSMQYNKAIMKRRELEAFAEKIAEKRKKKAIPKKDRLHITASDIRRVIHQINGVPIENLEKLALDRLQSLPSRLSSRIIGQEEAVKAIVSSLRRNTVGISDQNRPIGSFLFLGPTGVGKTELVKVLAEQFYADPKALIKIDMSEYQDRHNASKLIGTTAGYVGYEEGGILTDRVRRKPYSVVLFDEIEKGSPEIYNLLLQILEDGVITDGKGRAINFKNTIIVMTSNIGSEEFTNKAIQIGFSTSAREEASILTDYESTKEKILAGLTDIFSPEFLNRIDKTVVFNPLDKTTLRQIIELQLSELSSRLSTLGITFSYDESALELILSETYDPEYGARPVRRYIQDQIEDQIAEAMVDRRSEESVRLTVESIEDGSSEAKEEKWEKQKLSFIWEQSEKKTKKESRNKKKTKWDDSQKEESHQETIS